MARSTLDSLQPYLELMKPRVLLLVLFTGLPVFAMSAGGWPPPLVAAAILLGITLAGGAANTLNCYLERDRDALMERTRERPLPSARIRPRDALLFGLVLSGVATAILYTVGGGVAAVLGAATILFYVFVYTLLAKPRTTWSAIIGGFAGAASPLIADAAVHGQPGPAGLVLFGIIFFWQPPHVWAITLYRRSDYDRAGIPVPPSRVGEDRTRRRMFWSALPLWPTTLALQPLGLVGWLYTASAVLLGLWFAAELWGIRHRPEPAAARRVFAVSLAYLGLLFAAMLADRWVLG